MAFDNVEQSIIVKNLNFGYVFYHLVKTFKRTINNTYKLLNIFP